MPVKNQNRSPLKTLTDAVKGWVKVLFLLFGLLCFVAVLWWLYCLRENQLGRNEWARVKAELEAEGEKLDWESFVAEPIPDEINFAEAPLIKSISLRTNGSSTVSSWIDFQDLQTHLHVGDASLQKRSNHAAMVDEIEVNSEWPVEWTAEAPADRVREWFAFDAVKELELVEAGKRPGTLFPLYRFDVSGGEYPNYVNFRFLAQRIGILASADLARSEPEQAWELLRVNFALSRGLHGRQQTLVATMIGTAIETLTIGVVWEGMVLGAWEEQQLVEIEWELSRRDLIASVQDAMRRERAQSEAYFSDAKSTIKFYDLARFVGEGGVSRVSIRELAAEFLPDGWAYRSRAIYARWIQDGVIAFYDSESRVARPSVLAGVTEEIGRIASSKHPRDRFVGMAIPNFTKVYVVAARAQVGIDHVRIAIAIERYRRKHQSLPTALGDLAPEFMEVVPHDVVGGGPYRFRPLTDVEYMLWSVGWNEVDEEGALAVDREAGDWVWFSFAKDEVVTR